MDAIESIDVGAYAHFRHQAETHPEFLPIMHIAYYLSNYLAIGVLFSLTALLFLLQGKRRSAQVTAINLAWALALLFSVRFLVPRRRPDDAQNWLGPQAMLGSYPSGGVFLFMLAMILLGFAIWDLAKPWLRGVYLLTAVALTVWVCMSQLIMSLHYLTDILGGIAAATFMGWIASHFLDGKIIASELPSDAIQDLSHKQGIHAKP